MNLQLEAQAPSKPTRRPDGTYLPGVSGWEGGRGKYPVTSEQVARNLITALEAAVDKDELAAKAVSMAMAGSETMMMYVYNRICGSPVQRHEAKLETQVDNIARIMAKRYGMSEEEVRARAKAIATGT